MTTTERTQHTRGPWKIDEWGHIVAPDGALVRFTAVTTAGGNVIPESVYANDRLIAAAPALLAACKAALLTLEEIYNSNGESAKMLRAAIAAAEPPEHDA